MNYFHLNHTDTHSYYNKQIKRITSTFKKQIIELNLHLPSLQQYKVPYQKHRYHQGTYGYPCYEQEQIDRFEQL